MPLQQRVWRLGQAHWQKRLDIGVPIRFECDVLDSRRLSEAVEAMRIRRDDFATQVASTVAAAILIALSGLIWAFVPHGSIMAFLHFAPPEIASQDASAKQDKQASGPTDTALGTGRTIVVSPSRDPPVSPRAALYLSEAVQYLEIQLNIMHADAFVSNDYGRTVNLSISSFLVQSVTVGVSNPRSRAIVTLTGDFGFTGSQSTSGPISADGDEPSDAVHKALKGAAEALAPKLVGYLKLSG